MTAPMRSDEYVLPEHNVIGLDGQPVNIEPPAGMLANALAEEEAKPKPKGRPKGAKNKKRKAKAKTAKPLTETTTNPTMTATLTPGATTKGHVNVLSTRIAPSGEGIWDRVRRITPDGWLIIAAVVAMLALGTTLAVVIGGAKIW